LEGGTKSANIAVGTQRRTAREGWVINGREGGCVENQPTLDWTIGEG